MVDGPKQEILHRAWTEAEREMWGHWSGTLIIDLPGSAIAHPFLGRLIMEELGRPGVIDITDEDRLHLQFTLYGTTLTQAADDFEAVKDFTLARTGLEHPAIRERRVTRIERDDPPSPEAEAAIYEFPLPAPDKSPTRWGVVVSIQFPPGITRHPQLAAVVRQELGRMCAIRNSESIMDFSFGAVGKTRQEAKDDGATMLNVILDTLGLTGKNLVQFKIIDRSQPSQS